MIRWKREAFLLLCGSAQFCMDERERKKGNACLPGVIVRQLGSQIDAAAGKPKFPLYKATYLFCEKTDTFLRSTGTFIYEVRHTHIL